MLRGFLFPCVGAQAPVFSDAEGDTRVGSAALQLVDNPQPVGDRFCERLGCLSAHLRTAFDSSTLDEHVFRYYAHDS